MLSIPVRDFARVGLELCGFRIFWGEYPDGSFCPVVMVVELVLVPRGRLLSVGSVAPFGGRGELMRGIYICVAHANDVAGTVFSAGELVEVAVAEVSSDRVAELVRLVGGFPEGLRLVLGKGEATSPERS